MAYPRRWTVAWLVMASTMLIDLDHLLATPVYDPLRCSIGYHPLHGLSDIGIYAVMLFWPKLRLIAIGLLVHMALDGLDCFWMKWG